MQDYYAKRGPHFQQNTLFYQAVLSVLILFLCYLTVSLYPFSLVTGILFFCTCLIGLAGLWFGLLASLGAALLVLFLFGTALIWTNFTAASLELSVPNIIFWMVVFPAVAVASGIYQQWIAFVQAENKQLKMKFKELVTIDEATGFDNQRRFHFELAEEFSRSQRTGLPFSLVLFQIKHFKQFEKLYGLKETKHLLSFVSDVLWQKTRMSDRKFRIEVDTFAILLTNTGAENIATVIQKLEQHLQQHLLKKKPVQVKLTISFGFSSFSHDFKEYTEMIQHADQELQQYIQ